MNDLVEKSLVTEEYREYDFSGRVYRIDKPVALFFKPGSSTHRVVDEQGIAHCLPAPGHQWCVLRWKTKDKAVPVNF